MEKFQAVAKKHFYFSLGFFGLGLSFGLLYSFNLLGMFIDSEMLNPSNLRSAHISLMLYGFIPLMLSYLPFFLIVKDIGYDAKSVRLLEIYTIFWYVFLIAMTFSLLMGVKRDLAFYDFHYSLNALLAFAGVFYIASLYRYITLYEKKPLWIKVSLAFVVVAPFALLILMNPSIGQVEATISGPHGDNTLGMSLTLIPLYYLIIKYLSTSPFQARWHVCWIIPTVFYLSSVLYRSVVGPLSYEAEWFFQWLTFLYVPLLYRWFQDADIEPRSKRLLLVSIVAFLFVDIEGNLLFIESIRWVFHRNDLIVAHAHVAMGIGVLFMTLSLFGNVVKELLQGRFVFTYLFGMLGMFAVLSVSGFFQAGQISSFSLEFFWSLRSLFGLIALFSLGSFLHVNKNRNPLQQYNVLGVLADGVGGFFLFLFAGALYPLLGFSFYGTYEYIVFAFVMTTGVIHYIALKHFQYQIIITRLSVMVRFLVGSIFLALYLSSRLGIEAFGIFAFDYLFASIYLGFFYQKEKHYATL
ncbi:MAG: hypothetical protein IBX45_11785 [Campylobacterales bacterium]|nr:hypothetical protein [Campylobacterales bacterium]